MEETFDLFYQETDNFFSYAEMNFVERGNADLFNVSSVLNIYRFLDVVKAFMDKDEIIIFKNIIINFIEIGDFYNMKILNLEKGNQLYELTRELSPQYVEIRSEFEELIRRNSW